MFVTRQQATERLSSRDNFLREGKIAPSSIDQSNGQTSDQAADLEIPEIPDGEEAPEHKNVGRNKPGEKAYEVDKANKGSSHSGTLLDAEEDEGVVMRGIQTLDQLDALIHPSINGRANYRSKMPAQLAIGETALIIGQAQAGHMFDLSRAQAEAYEHGDDGSGGPDLTNPKSIARSITRRAHLDQVKETLAIKAAAKLNDTLELLTTDKLATVKRATNISKIAKDMASVVKSMEGEAQSNDGVHFHVYRPEVHNDNQYNTIVVGAKV